MKPAIVCLLWDKNLNVLVHYLARNPCTILAPSSNKALHQVAAILGDAGGEVKVLDSFLTHEAVAEIEIRVEAGIQQFAVDLADEKWAGFCERERVTPAIAEHVITDMASRLKTEMVLIEALHLASQAYKIELMVVNEDFTRFPRTAVEWARVRGIPSLHLSHGMPLGRPYTVHGHLSADVLALYGERDRQAFADVGIATARMRVVGNPGWDAYTDAADKRDTLRSGLCVTHKLDQTAPIVVFGTTWAAFLTAADDLEARYTESLRSFFRSGRALLNSGRALNLVVKDRPSNAATGRKRAQEIAAEEGVSEAEYRYATDDAFNWVVGADVLVSIDSNLSVEAMLAGTPAINLMNDLGLRMGPSFESETGILEVPSGHLADAIARLLDDDTFRLRVIEKMQKRVPRYNIGVDGLATRRVAALMLEMAGVAGAGEVLAHASKKRYVWESLGGGAGERDAHEVYMSPPRREVVAMFQRPPKRVLEVGCSTGSTGKFIKEQYPDSWVAGIELSVAAANVAAKHVDVVINEKFEDCTPEDHGITPGSIDTVILADVLEHMYDPWGVLVRIRPYLTPDAQVIASIPNARNLWLMNELASGRFPYAAVGLLDITHIRFFTRAEIEKLFGETGYHITHWGRTPDARLYRLQFPAGAKLVETEKLVLKDVTPEEFEDLKCLQFLVCASPAQVSGLESQTESQKESPKDSHEASDLASDASANTEPDGAGAVTVRDQPIDESASALSAVQARLPRARQGVFKVAVYSLDVQTSACPQIRFFKPFRGLSDLKLMWGVHPTGIGSGWRADLDIEADIYVISRLFPGAESVAMMDALFAKGKPVIYETDDLLIDLPAENMHAAGYAERKTFIEDTMRRAHAVVVSTPELAMRLASYNRNVHVLPNLIDYALFYQPPPDNRREVRIGILGTSTRGSDFALLDEALRRVCDEYGKRVRLYFVGGMPDAWLKHPNAEQVAFLPEYGAFAARLKGLKLDIGLAPLADHAFNICKSPIKWLEFAAIGAAGIFSAVPAYQGVIQQGSTGLLVDNHPDKWVSAIKLLIDYPEKRLEIALAAQRAVLQDHSLQRNARRVWDMYRRLETSFSVADASALAANYVSETDPEVDPQADPAADQFYRLWQAGHVPKLWDMGWIASRLQAWQQQGICPPVLHFGVICRAGREGDLAQNIQSLYAQFYKSWRLTVVAEVPKPDALADLTQVEWLQAAPTEAIEQLSLALAQSTSDWVSVFEAGDSLPPHATFSVAEGIVQHPHWKIAYTDEDRVDDAGQRHSPFFKTDFDPDMLRAAPFTLGGLLWLSREHFVAVGGLRSAFEGVESWDLMLRAMEGLTENTVGHLADVLYHRSESGGHSDRPAADVLQSAQTSLAEHLARIGQDAVINEGLLPGCFQVQYRVQSNGQPDDQSNCQPLVSILLPTGEDVDALKTSLTHLIEGTGYSHCEVLVLEEGAQTSDMQAYLQALRELGSESLRVLAAPLQQATKPTSLAGLLNAAVEQANGEFVVLFNPALQVMQEDWLTVLLGHVQQADVGAVGARFINPEGQVTHAGWILGLNGMSLGQVAAGHSMDDPGYYGRLCLPQRFSAIDMACLIVSKADFTAVGGLSERIESPELVSADLCQRLRACGLRTLWTPHATLRDVRTTEPDVFSRDKAVREADYRRESAQIESVVDAWPSAFSHDPAYNPNLSLMLPFSVEPTPILTYDPAWRPAPRILALHADTMGCGEYRITAPMRSLIRSGKVMGWDAGGYFHPREYARFEPDSIVMQRQLQWGQIELIQRITRISKAFRVFELDDLITNIPIMSSQKKVFVEQKDVHKRFRKAVSLFNRFVVSTEYLAETFKGYCDEIVVVPNYLERARWDGLTPQRLGAEKARVGWAGSSTHAGDLRLIEDVVKATSDEVDWIFFGMCPDAIRHLVKEYHEPVKLQDYASKLASLNLDLAIAPLEDIPFNHGKSHLRLLEYGVMGYPVICTDITPYRGSYPVVRVPNRFKDWVDAIRSQVSDRDSLAQQGDALRSYIQQNWMLEDHLDVWLKAWTAS